LNGDDLGRRRTVPVRELDVRGFFCPLPILRTRALVDTMASGEEVIVRTTDPASVIDFKHFCNVTGHQLLAHERQDDIFVFHIRKDG
jgi:tRNA 2-thiouridine synthesizing protein A